MIALAIESSRLHAEVEARSDASKVLTHVGDGVFLLDQGSVIRLWNPAAAAITGVPAEAALGKPVSEAIPGWQEVAERVPVGATSALVHAEALPLDTERGERWISISAVDFFGGTVYAFRDITEAHRLDELKTEFIATASHELRTPLAAVYGAAQTLRRHDFALDEAGRARFISLIVDESERLARIVNQILLANQLEVGRLDLMTEPFDAPDLLVRVVEAARTHAPPHITFAVQAAEGVPPVAADKDRVRQILVNLVENAIKYSPGGGRIELGAEPADGAVLFRVVDEGLGIPAEEQRRIFEKFYRLDPDMTQGIGGTGLGLYICSELVERMGGHIWVESEEGIGSSFLFELPSVSSHRTSSKTREPSGKERGSSAAPAELDVGR
jgi:PAS domain S-box-containing protein